MIERKLVERVASVHGVIVDGTFYRHAAPNREAFLGGEGGRWGETFPVIYLGSPESSAVIEAYRHLVEATGIPPELVRPRTLYTVNVRVSKVLDLRDPKNLEGIGLQSEDLSSDVDDYARCQAVAAAAHQLQFHGIVAPAAHGAGDTLALFRDRLSVSEIPVPHRQKTWEKLPADPRRLRSVQPRDAS